MRSRPVHLPATATFATVALALTLASCPQQPSTGDRSDGARVLTVVPATATASATAALAADAAPTAAPTQGGELPPRSGAPGSTTGTVSCGKVRCKAPGEVCGFDPTKAEWACVTEAVALKAQASPGPASEQWLFACDDASDCPAGEACCIAFMNQSFGAHSCVPKSEVNHRCAVEICLPDGAACPKDRKCTLSSPRYANDTAEEGTCVAPKGPATCAGNKKCPASAPVCVAAGKTWKCAAPGSPDYEAAPGEKRFECTREADCLAGESCQTSFGEAADVATFCDNYSMAYRGTLVCDPGPGFCGGSKDCLNDWACEKGSGAPPWMGFMRPTN